MSTSPTAVHDSLAVIARQGWDCEEGDRLLREVRTKVVTPQVSAARLTGPAAKQAEASGWEAAWRSLADPAFAQARDPWAMLWVIARRVLGEAVAGR